MKKRPFAWRSIRPTHSTLPIVENAMLASSSMEPNSLTIKEVTSTNHLFSPEDSRSTSSISESFSSSSLSQEKHPSSLPSAQSTAKKNRKNTFSSFLRLISSNAKKGKENHQEEGENDMPITLPTTHPEIYEEVIPTASPLFFKPHSLQPTSSVIEAPHYTLWRDMREFLAVALEDLQPFSVAEKEILECSFVAGNRKQHITTQQSSNSAGYSEDAIELFALFENHRRLLHQASENMHHSDRITKENKTKANESFTKVQASVQQSLISQFYRLFKASLAFQKAFANSASAAKHFTDHPFYFFEEIQLLTIEIFRTPQADELTLSKLFQRYSNPLEKIEQGLRENYFAIKNGIKELNEFLRTLPEESSLSLSTQNEHALNEQVALSEFQEASAELLAAMKQINRLLIDQKVQTASPHSKHTTSSSQLYAVIQQESQQLKHHFVSELSALKDLLLLETAPFSKDLQHRQKAQTYLDNMAALPLSAAVTSLQFFFSLTRQEYADIKNCYRDLDDISCFMDKLSVAPFLSSTGGNTQEEEVYYQTTLRFFSNYASLPESKLAPLMVHWIKDFCLQAQQVGNDTVQRSLLWRKAIGELAVMGCYVQHAQNPYLLSKLSVARLEIDHIASLHSHIEQEEKNFLHNQLVPAKDQAGFIPPGKSPKQLYNNLCLLLYLETEKTSCNSSFPHSPTEASTKQTIIESACHLLAEYQQNEDFFLDEEIMRKRLKANPSHAHSPGSARDKVIDELISALRFPPPLKTAWQEKGMERMSANYLQGTLIKKEMKQIEKYLCSSTNFEKFFEQKGIERYFTIGATNTLIKKQLKNAFKEAGFEKTYHAMENNHNLLVSDCLFPYSRKLIIHHLAQELSHIQEKKIQSKCSSAELEKCLIDHLSTHHLQKSR